VTRHNWQPPYAGPIHVDCSSGKTGWAERSHARAALKTIPKGHGMSAYLCVSCDYYHIGHLAPVVKRGRSER
jgi:hypothetical protein